VGTVTLAADILPTLLGNPQGETTKAYIDRIDFNSVKVTGNQDVGGSKNFTGAVTIQIQGNSGESAARRDYVEQAINPMLSRIVALESKVEALESAVYHKMGVAALSNGNYGYLEGSGGTLEPDTFEGYTIDRMSTDGTDEMFVLWGRNGQSSANLKLSVVGSSATTVLIRSSNTVHRSNNSNDPVGAFLRANVGETVAIIMEFEE
jgi:hypothetical protein